ncbi:MAG: hypothetical protein CO003_01560 [Candidatus Portnoybacteria bacterium CG_4_8_14_3_um_filter_44_15]|uniref:Small ribosomal subunit protein bS6 n=3 Tax=Candidatus Portnoyibacteriota TaxID=1817913 RepID=A0A2M7YM07_9BACT|nr:MAG: hypothetical protein AUJ11_01380 [Parcubacteria group bacterium CG1_02_44_65]PIP15563.1 MAG: hypothetical protein COX45_01905 [Candidatus Portnoybacteria bacterium CG23_combo_of_CG06-09_8_20_14_all_44_36]PIW74651.1 MAG: hypothetical protein CO003_01560 [Candidatus Portnoybacteria bacterium CG_4_8_14_3_um_filter_44_15]PJA64021.1 MAG: hypothetical protein CO160_00805 [Candidatus Portnoybacteria bacterium CG_4_9_14_3_um_filter_43_11]PJE59199.1 MAG: hypothetical protein COU84_01905 [Candida
MPMSETKRYRLKLIFSPLSEKDKVREVIDGLKKKIAAGNGVMEQENPSLESERKKTRFFYPIKKYLEGYYQTVAFSVSPDIINELEKHLRLQNNLLRFMLTVKKAEKAKPAMSGLDLKMIDKIEPIKETARQPIPEKEFPGGKKPSVKKEKVKIEELDKKLKEILGE